MSSSLKKQSRRGIYLAMALLLTLVLSMFLGAAVALAPGWLSQARVHSDQDKAEQAALSGVDYVLTRLRQNPLYTFNGTGNSGPRVTVDGQEQYVIEDRGNIVGLVWDSSSVHPSQFRLRFNYQDGHSGTETERLSDPTSGLWLDLPYVCLNNVPAAGERTVPKVSVPDYKVADNAEIQTVTPGRSVYLAVEGRAGQALNSLSRSEPNARPLTGSLSRKLIQAVYKVNIPGQQGMDSVVASAGDVMIDLPPGQGSVELLSNSSEPALIRAKGRIRVEGGGNPSVDSAKKGQLKSSGTTAASRSPRITESTENPLSPFLRLGNDLFSSREVTTVAAGVYVVDESRRLLYFNMTPEEYVVWMSEPANANSIRGRTGDDYTLPTAIEFIPGSQTDSIHELRVTQEVKVEPTSETRTFAFMPRRGAPVAAPLTPGPEGLSLANMEPDHFFTFSRLRGTTYSAEGHGGTEFGRVLNDYLYHYYRQTDPSLERAVVSGTIKVGAQKVDMMVHADGQYQIRNLPPASVKHFLRELAKLSPLDSAAPLASLQEMVEWGGGYAVPGATDRITTENLKLNFMPQAEGKAGITCSGRVVIAGDVRGNGGSIKAEDDITLYGFGVDLELEPEACGGVSLYTKKDINIQTFHEGQVDSAGKPHRTGFKDVCLKGILYAWGNINAVVGHPTRNETLRAFRLTGSMVCYGGDPDSNATPVGVACLIYVKAKKAYLEFDPSYTLNLMDGLPANLKLGRTSWSIR